MHFFTIADTYNNMRTSSSYSHFCIWLGIKCHTIGGGGAGQVLPLLLGIYDCWSEKNVWCVMISWLQLVDNIILLVTYLSELAKAIRLSSVHSTYYIRGRLFLPCHQRGVEAPTHHAQSPHPTLELCVCSFMIGIIIHSHSGSIQV